MQSFGWIANTEVLHDITHHMRTLWPYFPINIDDNMEIIILTLYLESLIGLRSPPTPKKKKKLLLHILYSENFVITYAM